MRLLIILFLIPVISKADYIKSSDIGLCDGVTTYTKLEYCGGGCVEIAPNYNCEYYVYSGGAVSVDDSKKAIFDGKRAAKAARKARLEGLMDELHGKNGKVKRDLTLSELNELVRGL